MESQAPTGGTGSELVPLLWIVAALLAVLDLAWWFATSVFAA